MSICSICGNELPGKVATCPYCGNAIARGKASSGKPKTIKKFNIKSGLPTVSEAIQQAKLRLSQARRSHVSIVKLVHGYGSTGVGGAIRVELRKELKNMQQTGILCDVIYGEEFSISNCRQLVRRFPDLKADEDFNKSNKGITIVVL